MRVQHITCVYRYALVRCTVVPSEPAHRRTQGMSNSLPGVLDRKHIKSLAGGFLDRMAAVDASVAELACADESHESISLIITHRASKATEKRSMDNQKEKRRASNLRRNHPFQEVHEACGVALLREVEIHPVSERLQPPPSRNKRGESRGKVERRTLRKAWRAEAGRVGRG